MNEVNFKEILEDDVEMAKAMIADTEQYIHNMDYDDAKETVEIMEQIKEILNNAKSDNAFATAIKYSAAADRLAGATAMLEMMEEEGAEVELTVIEGGRMH